jgi:hypothetical protein
VTQTPSIDDAQAWAAWFAAASRAEVDRALRSIYDDLGTEVAKRGPVCWASGRCCNFEKFGHRLYVTALETAWCVTQLAQAPPPQQALLALPVEPRGGCPFQIDTLCNAHAMRPLGCRVFFCQRGTEDWQHELYEQCQSRLRTVHEEFRIEYAYTEWRVSLKHAIEHKPPTQPLAV